ncbi:Ankyrin repeat [Abditibacterium utsteinense]|uniref:Ankyrin repeat n=1 Tax=Abditibacterium utsteinense TaxID=1960156 RepID=A0A2S8SX17_9BACT|nr:ankyrin repeat domain-containing protein [Abditibacterium utsteinense]PQV65341.1 Ankyrin repeat [Abditibacterium utsteinense]
MNSLQSDPRFYLLRDAMFGDWNTAEVLIAQDPTIIEARSSTGETALHYVAIEDHLEGVKWLLERGANVNTRDNFQSTPLIGAAQLGHEQMCRLLLDHGADLFAMDNIERTALSTTLDSEPVNRALLYLFLAHKGDSDINLLFGDLDADRLLFNKGPRIAEFWLNLGLQPRFESDEDEEAEPQ